MNYLEFRVQTMADVHILDIAPFAELQKLRKIINIYVIRSARNTRKA